MKRKCSKCKKEKDISEFHKRGNSGYQGHCKECKREGIRNHYQANKQTYIDKAKANNERAKEWLKEYKKTLSCKECGEDHPACLDFHHTDPNNKKYEVSKAVVNGISAVKNEITKCIVLCSNCHRKLHAPVV